MSSFRLNNFQTKPIMNIVNFYKVLGVDPKASDEVIIKAYRKKAKQYHPDQNDESDAAKERFQLILKAKETLTNPKLRAQHDQEIALQQLKFAPQYFKWPSKKCPQSSWQLWGRIGLMSFAWIVDVL